ncbi:glycosyltransferase family 2 protein [Nocardioides daphniae]|uniref:4,4'-diaponeurosporenoate glycosyltransferase n=1 Tax=Nocardioides daphniae TaxID=402297 RepID=A0A4P7UDC3_9ACTN|nr:glycosyltransferase family 2 protein [Nocardioides daphniae]QCC77541.1 glycosyltransferase family 2 protein [Nocardioides daphniae]GGD30953.1 glycosyl hydrolase [Nocardioides daphniae]
MSASSARSTPSVSVVIPVLDDAVELRECLALLARQEQPPLEVVVVDNGCTDDSVEVALAAGARVVREPRPGIPRAAAAGYDAALGDVVARLDADSRPEPDWLTRLTAAMTEEDVDAVTGPGRFHNVAWPLRALAGLTYLGAYYLLTLLATANTPLWGSSMAIRRSAWERTRHLVHLDADVHDDMDLSFALGPTARIRYVHGLSVGVSGRSLVGTAQLRRRFARAFTTLRLNWAVSPPWERWQQRLSAGRSGSAPASPGSR